MAALFVSFQGDGELEYSSTDVALFGRSTQLPLVSLELDLAGKPEGNKNIKGTTLSYHSSRDTNIRQGVNVRKF